MNYQKDTIMNNPYKELSPYLESDAYRFKGRTLEIEEMYESFDRNEYLVCHADSGEGKSSIIEAGLIPKMKSDCYFPIRIIFNSNKHFKNNSIDFDEVVCRIIDEAIGKLFENKNVVVNKVYPNRLTNSDEQELQGWEKELIENNSWLKLRYTRITIDNLFYTPVLIFDQFEEVFTNPFSQEWTDWFFAWLQELSTDLCPQRIVTDIEKHIGENGFPEISTHKYFKSIFSLRSEYVGQLDYWGIQRHYIPLLKNNRYLLRPLTIKGAKEVITGQEGYDGLNNVADDIVEMLRKLQKGKNYVESNTSDLPCIPALLLSIVCSRAFNMSAKEQSEFIQSLVTDNDNEKEAAIYALIAGFYEKAVTECEIPSNDMAVIEDVLVNNEGHRQRVSSHADAFKSIDFFNKYLEKLEKTKLIRVIPEYNREEDSIEFIHDVLCKVANKHRIKREQEKENRKKEEEAKRIEEENKQIKIQNDRLNRIRSLFLSEKAISCNRDRYLAQMLALEALPADIEHPDKPIVPQAESALHKSMYISYCPMMGHGGIVTQVMGTPDCTHILSSSRDKKICIWDVFSGGKLKELDCGDGSVLKMSISDDESKIGIIYTKKTIRICSLEDLHVFDEFPFPGPLPSAAAISPDGSTIAIGSNGGNVIFRSLGQDEEQLSTSIKKIGFLMFSPSGKELLVLGEGCLVYYSIEKREWNSIDKETTYAISCICYSKNGKYLFCGTENGKVIIFENCRGKIQLKDIIECEDAHAKINTISISFDTKKIVYSVGSKLITLECDPQYGWNPQKAKEQGMKYQTIKSYLLNNEYNPNITSVAWSPDGRYVIWGNTAGLVSLYDTKPGPQQKVLLKAASPIKALEYTPDGKKISCLSSHNTIRFIEIESGRLLHKDSHANNNTIGKEFLSADGKYRAVCNKARRELELYEGNKLKAKHIFTFEGETTSISFSSDSKFLALATSNGNVVCWDTNNGDNKYNLIGYKSAYNTVLFSPKGKIVATTASNREVVIGDEESGITNFVIPADKGYVSVLAFSPNGERLAVGMETGAIRIWNVATKEQIDILETNKDGVCVRCMSFSSDGEQLSAGYDDGSVIVWECPSLKALIKNVHQQLRLRKFTDDEKRKFYLEDNY